jgi:hypothetical protein
LNIEEVHKVRIPNSYYSDDQITEDEIDRAFSTQGKGGKSLNFNQKI